MTNPTQYFVRLSEDALIHMLLSVFEGYLVKHPVGTQRRRGVETIGQLWGHGVELPNGDLVYQIEQASADTSATRARSSVNPEDEALETKIDLMTSFFPHLSFMGDFHSHPYPTSSVRDVEVNANYALSDIDLKCLHDHAKYYTSIGYKVALVVTLAESNRSLPSQLSDDRSTVRFSFGKYCVWIHAGVCEIDRNGQLTVLEGDSERVVLSCPAVMGMIEPYCAFGGRAMRGKGPHQTGMIGLDSPQSGEG